MSTGNYIEDVDGNIVLDFHAHFMGNPLGYNHKALVKAKKSALYKTYVLPQKRYSRAPPHEYEDLVREAVMPIAPAGMNQVYLSEGTIT